MASLVVVLPTLPVTPTIIAAAARPRGARQIAQAFERIGHHDAALAAAFAFADQRRDGAIGQRRGDEIMPVEPVALDGDEQRIGSQLARIDGDGGNGLRGDALGAAAGGRQKRVDREKC